MKKITSVCALGGLLSACGPADGAVFFIAQKNGDTDTATVDVRDLTAVELDSFLGQQGLPIASEGDCSMFNDNLLDFSQLQRPGVSTDVGLITMTGASGEPLVNFTFDANIDTYTPDPANSNLFLAGDQINLSGAGASVINDFDKGIEFPQETILVELNEVLRGADLLVSWNPSDIKADEVSVAFVASDLLLQDVRTIVCSFRDTGAGTIPAALTNLLPSGGVFNTLAVARVNGVNLLLDPDSAIEQLKKGKEFIFTAFASDSQTGVPVNDP